MASPLERFATVARTMGLGRALCLAPWWLLRPEFVVLARDLRQTLPAIPQEPPLRSTVAAEDEVDLIRVINPALSEHEIRRRWRDGQRCVIVWYEGAPALWRWETEAPVWLPYLGLTLVLRAGDTLAVDVFTAVPFRGRGIYRAASIALLHQARARGCTRLLALAAAWNAPALRGADTRTSWTVVGSVGYWWVPPRRRFISEGMARVENGAWLHVL